MKTRTEPLTQLGAFANAAGRRILRGRQHLRGLCGVDGRLLRDIGLSRQDLPAIVGPGCGRPLRGRVVKPAALIRGIHNNFELAANDDRAKDAA